MSKPISLEAALRRVSRDAEKAFKKTMKYGAMKCGGDDPDRSLLGLTWITWGIDGEEKIIVPVHFDGGSDDRDRLARVMRRLFREHNIVRYAFISDVWIGTSSEVRPSEDPDRVEVVQIVVEDLSGERLVGMRKIVRSRWLKPYLDKLEVRDGADMVGRFCGLLLPDYAVMTGDQLIAALITHKSHETPTLNQEIWRRLRQKGEPSLRYSHDLFDEAEGDPFIARVPGVPLAVVGSRDPGNGELCVGGVGPDLNAEKLAEAETCCEMVIGEEAEVLISLITAKLEQNKREEVEPNATLITPSQLHWDRDLSN